MADTVKGELMDLWALGRLGKNVGMDMQESQTTDVNISIINLRTLILAEVEKLKLCEWYNEAEEALIHGSHLSDEEQQFICLFMADRVKEALAKLFEGGKEEVRWKI